MIWSRPFWHFERQLPAACVSKIKRSMNCMISNSPYRKDLWYGPHIPLTQMTCAG